MKKIRIVLLFCICMMLCGCGKKMDVDAVEKRIHGIVNGTEKYRVKEKGSSGGVDWFLTTDGMMIVTGDRNGHEKEPYLKPWYNHEEAVGLYVDIDNITSSMCLAYEEKKLIYADVSGMDTSELVNFGELFVRCDILQRIDGLENWDVSHAEKMKTVFIDLPFLTDLSGVSNWDVTNVTDFQNMFTGCSALKSLNLSNWDVSNATDFSNMFTGCTSLETIDVSGWDVSKGEMFFYIFSNCEQLINIVGVEDWNVDQQALISGMFEDCASIKELDLSHWVVEDSNLAGLFHGCTSLEKIDLRNCTLKEYAPRKTNIFDGCDNLKEVYLNSSFKKILESDKYEGYVPDCITYVD